MKKNILLFSLFLLFQVAIAQKTEEVSYNSEFIYGIMLTTNGGLPSGIMLKYANRVNSFGQYQSFGAEIAHIKHPRELRFLDRATGNSFIFNKLNYLFAVRPQYGREFVLFQKAEEEGIHLNAIFAVGPSIGVVKPYYILWEFPANNVQSVPYDPNRHNNALNIRGAGRFTDGIDKISFNVGGHIKTALNFEFGMANSNVIGLECGVTFETYSQTTLLMASSQNTNRFSMGFVTLYYGNKR
jgi:hypothetical protein